MKTPVPNSSLIPYPDQKVCKTAMRQLVTFSLQHKSPVFKGTTFLYKLPNLDDFCLCFNRTFVLNNILIEIRNVFRQQTELLQYLMYREIKF